MSKLIAPALAALALTTLGACETIATETVTALDSEAIAKAEIKELVDTYAIARDALDAEGYGGVFTEDGILVVRGEPSQGREAIGGRLSNFDASAMSVHIMSTSQIDIVDTVSATGKHYAIVYGGQRAEGDNENAPVAISNFSFIGIYTDEYAMTDEGWKISKREFAPVFVPE